MIKNLNGFPVNETLLFFGNEPQPSLSSIQTIVEKYLNIDKTVILSPGHKTGNIAHQIPIYLACKHTRYSHQVIANFFTNSSRYGVARAYYKAKKHG